MAGTGAAMAQKQRLLMSTLVIIIKDVVDSDKAEIARE